MGAIGEQAVLILLLYQLLKQGVQILLVGQQGDVVLIPGLRVTLVCRSAGRVVLWCKAEQAWAKQAKAKVA